MTEQNSRKRGPRRPPLHERMNAELHGGGSVADDRGQLLGDQRAKIAKDRQRPRPSTTAIAERVERDRVALGLDVEPAPVVVVDPADRALTAQERHEAAELAANRRTVWLPQPVLIPGTTRRCFAYDPLNCPKWLREVLDAPAATSARFGAYVENENTNAKGGKDASSSTPH